MAGDNGPRGKSRVPRGPGFSGEEIKFLFKTVEALLPGSMDEWDALARDYNARFPLASRSGESLRRKFLKLGRADYTERARRIKVLIQKRLRKEAGFQLPEDLEEAAGGEDAPRTEQELAMDDRSWTDSDARAGRSDMQSEGGDGQKEDAPREERAEAAELEPSEQVGRRASDASSTSDPDNANVNACGDHDRPRDADGRSSAVEAVTSVSSCDERPVDTIRAPSELPIAPTSEPIVFHPPPTSVSTMPAMTRYQLPTEQPQPVANHYPPPPSDPEHLSSVPPQRPLHLVSVGHSQREIPMPTALSSPTAVNRWFALEERRLAIEEQRVAVEQRRLAVEERRVQLLEQRMDVDAEERRRLLEALQLALQLNNGESRNGES